MTYSAKTTLNRPCCNLSDLRTEFGLYRRYLSTAGLTSFAVFDFKEIKSPLTSSKISYYSALVVAFAAALCSKPPAADAAALGASAGPVAPGVPVRAPTASPAMS